MGNSCTADEVLAFILLSCSSHTARASFASVSFSTRPLLHLPPRASPPPFTLCPGRPRASGVSHRAASSAPCGVLLLAPTSERRSPSLTHSTRATMAVAAPHPGRISWTQTALAELDIEDLLDSWQDSWGGLSGGQGTFVPLEEGADLEPRPHSPSPAPKPRLSRTSSLLQLAVEPSASTAAHLQRGGPRQRSPSSNNSSNASSPIESLDPGYDFFQFPPTPSGVTCAPPPTSSAPADSTKRERGEIVSLEDIFGATPGRSSPFPTLSSTSHLATSSHPAPRAPSLLKNVRALAERFEANLPPAPVLATTSNHHSSGGGASTPRPSLAPSSASIASGSTGSGSGSSASTARAENRPLAMYPRPPPAPRGAQQYPRPPPLSKEKKARKNAGVEGGDGGEGGVVRKEGGGKTWGVGGISVRGGFALR